MRYLLSHWRGQQGLAWTFWVNLVMIRIVIFMLQDALFEVAGHPLPASGALLPGLVSGTHIIVLVWQAVGLVRACDEHLRHFGSRANTWGAQLGLIIALIHTGLYVMSAWQATAPPTDDDPVHQRRLDERASRYRIESPVGTRLVRISGTLELGVTDALRSHLEEHPRTETVVLDSDGGNIHEARGLARTLREHGLDTRVDGRCSSACTIAFIGGSTRVVSSSGQLGFHRYRIDARYPVPFANILKEQKADQQLYASAGVSAEFVARMFEADAQALWFPTHRELLNARVVTVLVD